MRKHYLFFFVALMAGLFVAPIQAQVVNQEVVEEAPEGDGVLLDVAGPQKAEAKPNAVFYIPDGALFCSYDLRRGWYRQNDPILHIPAFVDLTFKNATSGATSYSWNYVDPSKEYNMFNPRLTSTNADLTVNYMAYSGNMEAPILTATNEEGDSISPQLVWIRAGGGPIHLTTVSTTAHYFLGNSPADTKSSAARYGALNYFAVNTTNANKTWTQRLKSQNDTVKIKGLAELFFKPTAPYALREVHVPIYLASGQSVNSDFKLTISCVEHDPSTGAITILKELATQTLSKSEMQYMSIASGNTYYRLEFSELVDAESDEVVEGFTIDQAILITLQLTDPDDETSAFCMNIMEDKLKLPNKYHAYVLYDGVKDGVVTKNLYGRGNFAFTSGLYTRSLPFLLEASFEYLIGTETEWEAPKTGGTKTIDLSSSVAYQDALKMSTYWTITLEDGTPLPSWLSATPTDSYNTEKEYENSTSVKFVAAANNAEDREAVVKISFIGGVYKFKITQKATNSIQHIDADDDADAPLYNIAGQRVGSDYKGIVVKKGKKQVVK